MMAIHLKAVWPAQSIVGSRFEPLLARLAGVLSEHRNVLDVPTKPSAAIYPFHYVAELSNKYSYSYSYIWKEKKMILVPKINFGDAGEAFLSDLCHFSEIEDFFRN